MLAIISNMYNNIQPFGTCYERNCVNSSSVNENNEDCADWVGGQSRFCLVTDHIK